MKSSQIRSGLEPSRYTQASAKATGGQITLTPLFRIFRTIPPERVGLHGEYDHTGLAKRVALAFSEQFELEEVTNLRITQRGTVVVLVGKISHQRLTTRLVNVALGISGAADVEINGVSVIKPLRVCADESESVSSAQAC